VSKLFGIGHAARRPHRFFLGFGWVEQNNLDRFVDPYPERWCVWFAHRWHDTRWLFRGPYRWTRDDDGDDQA